MAHSPVPFKRGNHRLLLCEASRKDALLAHLIETHSDKRIVVVTSGSAAAITVPESVTLLNDENVSENATASFDLLISYDLPETPQHYLERLALAEETALALLGETDGRNLLGIERLLGRAIPQERPEGFAPAEAAKPAQPPKRYKKPSARLNAEAAPKKAAVKPKGAETGTNRKPKPAAARKPKASGVSRYIGKDENGKPMFSGKTGERNHRYDGKPHGEESLAAKREWEEKRKKNGGKKPYDMNKKPASKGPKKPYDAKSKTNAAPADKPKRPVRRIKADKFKSTEPKE